MRGRKGSFLEPERDDNYCDDCSLVVMDNTSTFISENKFLLWSKEHGIVVHPLVDLFAICEDGVRGVQAKKNLNKGEVIIEVPETAYFSPASKSPVTDYLLEHNTSKWLTTVLLLMHYYGKYIQSSSVSQEVEKKNSTSKKKSKEELLYNDYFAILPKPNDFTTPLYFTEEEKYSIIQTDRQILSNVSIQGKN